MRMPAAEPPRPPLRAPPLPCRRWPLGAPLPPVLVGRSGDSKTQRILLSNSQKGAVLAYLTYASTGAFTLAVGIAIMIEGCCIQMTYKWRSPAKQAQKQHAIRPRDPWPNTAQATPESAMPAPISNSLTAGQGHLGTADTAERRVHMGAQRLFECPPSRGGGPSQGLH